MATTLTGGGQVTMHASAIKPVIHAEMSLSFSTLEAQDRVGFTMALELRQVFPARIVSHRVV